MSWSTDNIASFALEAWHPLTEPPVPAQGQSARPNPTSSPRTDPATPPPADTHTAGLGPVLTRVLP